MLAAHEISFEELLGDLLAELVRDDARAHAEHVSVVVEACELAGLQVAANGCANAFALVCGHAHSDARSANENAAVGFLSDHFVADFVCVNRVVAGVGGVRSHVEHGVALLLEVVLELVLVFDGGVIAADGDGLEHFVAPGVTS